MGSRPLKPTAVGEASTPVGRRTVSAIDIEPVTRLLHGLQRPRSILTGGHERVWLRRRLYWLRCRIVNANGTQVEGPPARPKTLPPGVKVKVKGDSIKVKTKGKVKVHVH